MSNDPSRAEAKKTLDELKVYIERINKLTKKRDAIREQLMRRIEDNQTKKENDIRVELDRQLNKKTEELALANLEFDNRIKALKNSNTK